MTIYSFSQAVDGPMLCLVHSQGYNLVSEVDAFAGISAHPYAIALMADASRASGPAVRVCSFSKSFSYISKQFTALYRMSVQAVSLFSGQCSRVYACAGTLSMCAAFLPNREVRL